MLDGSIVKVWADSLQHPEYNSAGEYRFCCLMDVSPEEQAEVLISARTPSDPERVLVVVASFPAASVDKILSSG